MRKLELLLADGAVEVTDVSDATNPTLVWASDDDPDFLEEVMRGQEFIEPRDLEQLVDYLIREDVLSVSEANAMEDYEATDDESVADAGEDWDDDDAPHRELDHEDED